MVNERLSCDLLARFSGCHSNPCKTLNRVGTQSKSARKTQIIYLKWPGSQEK